MPQVQVNLYAAFRAYSRGRPAVDVEIDAGQTVRDVLEKLGVPADEARIIFVNNRASDLTQPLAGGDRLGVFPAIGGG